MSDSRIEFHVGGYAAPGAKGVLHCAFDPQAERFEVLGGCDALENPSWVLPHPERPLLYAVEELPEGRLTALELVDGRWEKRASLKNDHHLQTWVIRILINVCHDIQRERKRLIPTEKISEPVIHAPTDTVDLRNCLFQLDERERIPIMLHYIEGYEVREIAAILRIPQGTVKSRLDRGRRQLKDICREEVFEP